MATAAEMVGAKLPDDAGEDSVSLLGLWQGGRTEVPVREATVHQSSSGDLALRHGPWKQIFWQDGRRELYNLQMDLSETRDVSAENPEIAERLEHIMQGYLNRGRSTRGADQKNEANISLSGKARQKGKKGKK
jgi:arylsulfatase A